MAKNLAAVLGTGQTKYVAKRHDVSMNGLVREAIDKALADSGSTFDDIDAVVVGKAPDFFEGVMMPELFMADAVGATGKPLIRVHTAGSVCGSTAIVAASFVVRTLAVCGIFPEESRRWFNRAVDFLIQPAVERQRRGETDRPDRASLFGTDVGPRQRRSRRVDAQSRVNGL